MSERTEKLRRLSRLEQRVDPLFGEIVRHALGEDQTILSVGVGVDGALADRRVIAVDPGDGTGDLHPDHDAEALRATPWDLPLDDDSVDAAMAVRVIHHWGEHMEAGVRELRRIARNRVVIVTLDPSVNGELWIFRDYLPQIAEQNRTLFPPVETLAGWLGGHVVTSPVLLPRDSIDWSLSSSWAHPEAIRDSQQQVRSLGLSSLDTTQVDRALSSLERDLADGRWDRRNGHLRAMYACDTGHRLLVATPT
jgi:SAM-dependent methyltransferase